MSPHQIEVVLTAAALDLDGLADQVATHRKAIDETSHQLDTADQRLTELLARLPAQAATDIPVSAPPADGVGRTGSGSQPSPNPSWENRVLRARDRIASVGIDPDTVDLDALLSPEDLRRIDRRHPASFQVKAQLDAYDVLVAVAAGLAATAVDVLLVRVPKDMNWDGSWQTGSPMTKALHKISVDPNNWLGRWAKASFDQVKDTGIEGMGPFTHRVHTMGHDPLIGLVVGTIDIMRGTLTGVSKTGAVSVIQTSADPVSNPFVALVIEIAHLLSDIPTRMGLPLPGWSILMTAPVGSIGSDGLSLNELARQMYLRGYNTTHLFTMAAVPATVELILTGYWELRRYLDADFAAEIRATSHRERRGDPRFQALLLLGHAVAVAGNLAKLAGYGGNPLALNYAEWMAFTARFFSWSRTRLASPTDTLLQQMARNQQALDAGWVSLGLDDPAFAALVEETWPRTE